MITKPLRNLWYDQLAPFSTSNLLCSLKTRHIFSFVKVRIFWEGHKLLKNLHLNFVYSTYRQKKGEDFSKFCGLLRKAELYHLHVKYVYIISEVDRTFWLLLGLLLLVHSRAGTAQLQFFSCFDVNFLTIFTCTRAFLGLTWL